MRTPTLVPLTVASLALLLATSAAVADGADSPAAEAAIPGAGDACALAVAARVQVHYDALKDLEADFVQTTRAVAVGASPAQADEPARGHVVFAKPGRMRWTYETPEPSVVVSDGETLWLYDVDAREVQRLRVQKGYLTGAALQFLLGEGDLVTEFVVTSSDCPAASGEPPDDAALARLDLVPRSPASFERMGLTARLATGEIVETSIVDLFGNSTLISFRGLRVNQSPPPETFRFQVPEGVEVIDVTPPS